MISWQTYQTLSFQNINAVFFHRQPNWLRILCHCSSFLGGWHCVLLLWEGKTKLSLAVISLNTLYQKFGLLETASYQSTPNVYLYAGFIINTEKDQYNSNLKPELETACSQKRAIDAHSRDTCPRTPLHSTRAASTTSRPYAVWVNWKLIERTPH